MRRTAYRRKDILEQLAAAVAVIGGKVFVTDRPSAEQAQMDDFVIVRLSQPIRDMGDTYQESYCQVNVFARDRSNGQEDTARLEEMQAEVVALFPLVTGLFAATGPVLMNGGSDGLGFHSLVIQAKLTINK